MEKKYKCYYTTPNIKNKYPKNNLYTNVLLIILVITTFTACTAKNNSYSTAFFAMDTPITIAIQSDNSEHLALSIKETTKTFHNLFDAHGSANGSVGALNQHVETILNDTVTDMLQQAIAFKEQFGGVDPLSGGITRLWKEAEKNLTLPTHDQIINANHSLNLHINYNQNILLPDNIYVDVGAFAKGYTCGVVYNILTTANNRQNNLSGTFSMGSSSLLFGGKPDNSAYKIGIAHPFAKGEILQTFQVNQKNVFVSTAGTSERSFQIDEKQFTHIIDLKTGMPTESDLVSVTVAIPATSSSDGLLSDALSTRVLLGGSDELPQWSAWLQLPQQKEKGIIIAVVFQDNSDYSSNNAKVHFL